MKKLTAFISTVLAGAMLLPTAAAAADETFPKCPAYLTIDSSDEEINEFNEKHEIFWNAMVDGYRDGSIDFDLNIDGEVNALDVCAVVNYYSDLATNKKSDHYYDIKKLDVLMNRNPEDITDEDVAAITHEMNDEIREKILTFCEEHYESYEWAEMASDILTLVYMDAKIGDVNMDGVIDADDASEILSVYSDRSVGKDIITYTQDQNFKHCADINEDGIVDACDASDVLRLYSENSTS